jgi:multidrug efflux pump subunit AcrB
MKISEYALKNRTVISFATILLVIGGIISYVNLGRLADPTFKIKIALIVTQYPGASPKEVENEVSDVIEEAVQKLSVLDYVESVSQEGLSIVYVNIKDTVTPDEIQQVWDELRRKIADVQGELPPGSGPSIINDDFGDVYGIYFAITSEQSSYAELKEYAEFLKKKLLLVADVAKIDLWGLQQEVIYVEMSRLKMANLGISPSQIAGVIQSQNLVEPTGKVKVGNEYIRFQPTGNLVTEDIIGELLLTNSDGKSTRLKDVANIKREYITPARQILRFNGKKAVALGISVENGGNVVTMGNAVKACLADLNDTLPKGMQVNIINFQADRVTKSLDLFVENLIEAVAIVIVLLLIFMGFRAGLMMGCVLLITILGTFLGMWVKGIELQKMSLGALVIALGMLVDNAIVVVDGFLIKRQLGIAREQAATDTVNETQWPLLGATLIAILAFTAIGFSPGNAGEFCRSLFWVMTISLALSWILAVTITPLLCVWFLPDPKQTDLVPFQSRSYKLYRRFLHFCICNRLKTILVLIILVATSIFGFSLIPPAFFSISGRNQFYIDYWRPESTHIMETAKDVKTIEDFIKTQAGVKTVTSFIGEGSLRFVLSYNYQSPDSSYAQILIETDKFETIDEMAKKIGAFIKNKLPDSDAKVGRFQEGPPSEYDIEVRVNGDNVNVLRALSGKIKDIFYADGGACNIRDDWRQYVKVLQPHYAEIRAPRCGISRSDLNQSLLLSFSSANIGLYREKDELIPIKIRNPANERLSLEKFSSSQVWSQLANRYFPIGQIVKNLYVTSESPIIRRRNRERTITAQCDPVSGEASLLRTRLVKKIEALELPPGYSLEWGGKYEQNMNGQRGLKKIFPACVIGMFFLLVCLFNSLRQPLIIFMVTPLALIGVTAVLLPFQLPFGFMAVLGFLGLIGMMIKNAIVLLEQINLEIAEGKAVYSAVLDASVSRLRPVSMASGTTILGVIPLVWSPFFAPMAATIMGGLFASTALTLLIVPVLYTIFFRVKPTLTE